MPFANLESQKKFGAGVLFFSLLPQMLFRNSCKKVFQGFFFSKWNHDWEKHAERNKEMLSRMFKFDIDYFCQYFKSTPCVLMKRCIKGLPIGFIHRVI